MAISSRLSLGFLLKLVALSPVVAGQALTQNWNPNGDGCVDSSGFLSCYNNLATKGASCLDGCDNNNVKGSQAYKNCVSACTGVWLAGNLGCWLQSCWNQVCFSLCYPRTLALTKSGILLPVSSHCRVVLWRHEYSSKFSCAILPPTGC
jgi:hypothetical protein